MVLGAPGSARQCPSNHNHKPAGPDPLVRSHWQGFVRWRSTRSASMRCGTRIVCNVCVISQCWCDDFSLFLPPVQNEDLTPLDDDCRLLGHLLDQGLKLEVGDVLFKKVGPALPFSSAMWHQLHSAGRCAGGEDQGARGKRLHPCRQGCGGDQQVPVRAACCRADGIEHR